MSLVLDQKIGLFVGSDTGNTDEIAEKFIESWKISDLELIEASNMKVEDYDRFQIIVIGTSTWYDGDLQSDFDVFFEEFKKVDFSGKIVALFGLGDQTGYAEYFVDGLGILGEVVLENGGQIIGKWSTEGYEFDDSRGLIDDNHFYGLALDFENQEELNESRLQEWIQQVESEIQGILEV